MTKTELLPILSKIEKFKERTGVKIVDTHIHPHDVMGVVHHSDPGLLMQDIDYLSPGLLERFGYGRAEKIGSKLFFKLFGRTVDSMIQKTYGHQMHEVIKDEMSVSLVDEGVLLSLDPWTPTDVVGTRYKTNKKFHLLGSFDIHNGRVEDIETKLKSYIDNYKIVGLKLHPNLQSFKPQPSHNSSHVCEKLKRIYSFASDNGLYILFHGGISNYTEVIHEEYGFYPRNRTNGVLENFCDSDGKSELFQNYTMPVVIAHIGHYGKFFHNKRLLKTIVDTYDNVYFDTSGVSVDFIAESIPILTSKKIVFGSDAVYNRIAYNLAFLYKGIQQSNTEEKFDDVFANILSGNFYSKLLK